MRPLLLTALLALILIAGCIQTGQPHPADYHRGTKGLSITLLDGYPEGEMYEEEPFPVVFELKNEGTDDVTANEIMVTFTFDPLYIDGPNYFPFEGTRVYHGRSELYPLGDEQVKELTTFATRKLIGLRQAPTTQLGAQLCYLYRTEFADQVCVDVDKYIRSGRPQVCEAEEIDATSQGAPVAIKHIEPRSRMVNSGSSVPFVKPEFIIDIANIGTGIVLASPQADLESVCKLEQVDPKYLGAVKISAQLVGLELECSPQIVKLVDGKGQTRCTIKDGDIGNKALYVQNNFITPISIQLDYVYRDTDVREITILRGTENNGVLPSGTEPGKVSGYMYIDGELQRDSNGPISECDYYAHHPENAPEQFTANFSCSCDTEECLQLDDAGFCFYGYCPGNNHCCDKVGYNRAKK